METLTIRECSYSEIMPLREHRGRFMGFSHVAHSRYVACFRGSEIIGCVGWEERKTYILYHTDVVHTAFRHKGIYTLLWNERERKTRDYKKRAISYCTKMSIRMYIKNGFSIEKLYYNTFKVQRQ